MGTYFTFFLKNFFRSHRYLREIVLILIFHVFFWGFLYSDRPEDTVWTVFGVLGMLLSMVTVPSVFYLEKKNSLYFVLVRPRGRFNFLCSKLFLIFLIDFLGVALFAIWYGIRFLDKHYWLLLTPRLGLIAVILIISILLLSLSFSYKPWIAWLLIVLIVFGGIINKSVLFPINSITDLYKLFTFFLPPFLEIIFAAVTLDFPFWRIIFLGIALIQIIVYFNLNHKLIQKKDFT
jgi:hypothetical protein